MLRGARVLARCDDGGALLTEGGRVEIRYKPKDGKSYRASTRNLKPSGDDRVFADAYCAEATRAPETKKKATKKKSGKSPSKGGSSVAPPTKPTADEVLVYTDGACSGNPGPAGLGVVMRWDEGRRSLSEYLGKGTNNIAELTAILRAVEGTPDKARPLRIYTDSSYAIGVLTKGWKPKANKELIARIKKALATVDDVELVKVKGHAGVPGNELADALAVQAVEARTSTGWLDE